MSAKIGRHFWRRPDVPLDAEDWDLLPGRFGFEPAKQSEWRDLLTVLRRAVDTELTPRQREIFVARGRDPATRPGHLQPGDREPSSTTAATRRSPPS